MVISCSTSVVSTQSNMKAKMTNCRQKSLDNAEKRLHKTCDQMEKLEARITMLRTRHQRALKRACSMAAVESLGLQLHVLEGIYSMYYNYAEAQCEEMAEAVTSKQE